MHEENLLFLWLKLPWMPEGYFFCLFAAEFRRKQKKGYAKTRGLLILLAFSVVLLFWGLEAVILLSVFAYGYTITVLNSLKSVLV